MSCLVIAEHHWEQSMATYLYAVSINNLDGISELLVICLHLQEHEEPKLILMSSGAFSTCVIISSHPVFFLWKKNNPVVIYSTVNFSLGGVVGLSNKIKEPNRLPPWGHEIPAPRVTAGWTLI